MAIRRERGCIRALIGNVMYGVDVSQQRDSKGYDNARAGLPVRWPVIGSPVSPLMLLDLLCSHDAGSEGRDPETSSMLDYEGRIEVLHRRRHRHRVVR
ncbi:hypothetical protein [Amycolatopsis sp. EV170708-02-1]|uniref:hypothetical protein n=1 Tax=Amycolatopsis sp. EV170708-02-1 TaxID=2919322 RepID=UPI001F0BEC02|nr:hypothetical protein [Amycolatopsis sp. EV170708-02-1]UMP06689.1 hypothetical protein MJQ72_18595 [Amycolatopsis sp. EV170708-02-1]